LDDAARLAAEVVFEELKASESEAMAAAFARVAERSPSLQAQDPKLAAALDLSEPEHAVIASLLELQTTSRGDAIEASTLLRHARGFTDAPIDPSGLTQLETRQLLQVVSGDRVALVLPNWTGHAAAAIVGRARLSLKRTPVPYLSPVVFELGMRPLFGAFQVAQFGLGQPSITTLAEIARSGAGGGVSIGSRDHQEPHVLARGIYAERPMWFVAGYEEEDAQTAVADALSGVSKQVLGGELSISDCHRHPMGVIPSERFIWAAARAFKIGNRFQLEHGPSEPKHPLATPLPRERLLELRVEAARLLRELATPLEKYAMGLEQAFSIYWEEINDARIECRVEGGTESATRFEGVLGQSGDDRFLFFDLEQALNLPPTATIKNINITYGELPTAYDPIVAEIASRRSAARRFNATQPRTTVVLFDDELERRVRDGFIRSIQDARVLQQLSIAPAEEIPPTAAYVHVLLEAPTVGWVPGVGARVTVVERVSESGEDELRLAVTQGGVDLSAMMPRAIPLTDDPFQEAFGFSADKDVPGFLGFGYPHDIDSLLGEYAGLRREDVLLRWPDDDV
jgi:hypothetical protein